MDIRPLLEESYKNNYKRWFKQLRHGQVTAEMAEDAVQDACVRALKFEHTYNTSMNFDDWMSRILRNALYDILGQERRGGLKMEYNDEADVREYKDEMNFDVVTKAKEDIATLKGEHREICTLYFLHDMKPREIEQVVESKGAAVRKCIQRFKKHLKENYGT